MTPYPALAPFRPLELQAPSENKTTWGGVLTVGAMERGGDGGGLMEAGGEGRLGGSVAGTAKGGGLAGVL